MNVPRGISALPSSTLPPRARRSWLALGLPLALAAAAYMGSLGCGFVWDDDDIVAQNVVIRSLRRSFIPFGSAYWHTYHMSAGHIYRPIRTVSLAVDYAVWGPEPLGFHLTNLLWHAAACAMTWWTVMTLTGSRSVGLWTAALFAVLPCHVESVVWVKNRADLMAYCFALATCVSLFRASTGGRRVLLISVATACYTLALLAKEVAVVVPLLAVVVSAAFARKNRCRAVIHTTPLWVVCAVYLAAKFSAVAQAAATAGGLTAPPPVVERVARTLAWYVSLLLWPINLNLDARMMAAPNLPVALLACAGAAVLTMVGIKKMQRAPALCAGMLWTFAGLLPVLNLVPLAGRPLAEQRTYLPSFGMCLVFGALLGRSRAARLGVVLLGLLGTLTVARVHVWGADVPIWRDAVRKSPLNQRAWVNLGNAYAYLDRFTPSLRQYEAALRVDPKYVEAKYRTAELYERRLRPSLAGRIYRRIIDEHPSFNEARHGLANTLISRGEIDQAEGVLRGAIEQSDVDYVAWLGLANVAAERQDWAAAQKASERAIEVRPDYIDARIRLAESFVMQGNTVAARRAWKTILQIDPMHDRARFERAKARALEGDIDGAIEDFTVLLDFHPGNMKARILLGRTYVLAGWPRRGLTELRRANSERPSSDTDLLCFMGDVARSVGLPKEAAEHYGEALAIDPSCKPARDRLVELRGGSADDDGSQG